jgi:hypothetical protein
MNVKCFTCGAVQSLDSNNNCVYCKNLLQVNEINEELIKDFTLIKYEFAQKNYKQVLKLSEKYLLKDPTNIPCWAYKITSEFVYCNYDFLELTNALNTLIDLNVFNNNSKFIIENILKDTLVEYAKGNSSILKIEYKHDKSYLNKFVSFTQKHFSSEFISFINDLLESETKYLELDPLFQEAARLVLNYRSAVLYKLIQRRFSVSYIRSNEIIMQLELTGIIGQRGENLEHEILIHSDLELDNKLRDLGLEIDKQNANQTNVQKSKSGCFIATATMGSYDHPVVVDLRLFRDEWLLKRKWGVQFTNWYYLKGPAIASLISKSITLRKLSFYIIVKPLHFVSIFLKNK